MRKLFKRLRGQLFIIIATKFQDFVCKRYKVQCNRCRYYKGVPYVPGNAPCSFWNIGAVMSYDFCSRFKGINKDEEPEDEI